MENSGITLSTHLKFHPHLPLFHNFSLCLGGHPIFFPLWSDKGINTLSDITSDNTLRSFQVLKSHFNLPGTSFFFYLQLRSALRAYRVPWGETWNLIQSIKYVEIFLPMAWCPLFTRSFLNAQNKLCSWIVTGAMISQWHLPQSIGP